MVAEMNAPPPAGQLLEMLETGSCAGDDPACVVEFASKIPFRRSPDILGVRRTGPWYSSDEAGISCHRCRCVNEMCMQPACILRQFGGENHRLTEAAAAISRPVTAQIGHKRSQRRPEPWAAER